MHVLVNATAARGGGVETYIIGLLPELLKINPHDTFTLIVPENRAQLYGDHKNLRVVPVPSRIIDSGFHRLLHEHVRVPQMLIRGTYDVFFQIDEMLSPVVAFLCKPTVSVVHATQHMLIPKQVGDGRVKLFYLNAIKALTMRKASAVITVSHHTKAELSGLYPSVRDRIQVIYHGIDQDVFKPATNPSSPLGAMSVERYLLSVSDRHAHKNYARLIKAYASLYKSKGISEHLVIVGRPKSSVEEKKLKTIIQSHGLMEKVHLLDYIEQAQLPKIYAGACAYVFPSTFETFGFTPLEAMACGIPVACAWCSAMPEICGDAVEYFDPYDTTDIVRAMETVLWDSQRRADLVALGGKRIKQFAWKQVSEKYHDKLSRIAKKPA